MPEPRAILDATFQRASENLKRSFIGDERIRAQIEYVSLNLTNRAGVRALMACLLAKLHRPEVDVRKPYTEIKTDDSFSGRVYDESYIGPFVTEHTLPCNSTTAFLTPALRNRYVTLTSDSNLVGSPPKLYEAFLALLDDVYRERISAKDLLAETVRCLVNYRNEQQERMDSIAKSLYPSV